MIVPTGVFPCAVIRRLWGSGLAVKHCSAGRRRSHTDCVAAV